MKILKKFSFIIILIMLISIIVYPKTNYKSIEQNKFNLEYINAKVLKVYDGDTITIEYKNKKVKIRLYGIDAPELKQFHGKISRDYLKNIINGNNVNIKVYSTDRYGRKVGEVFINDYNLNKIMVSEGMAFVYDKYNNKLNEYKPLEDNAKLKKIGIWNPKYKIIKPELYRKMKNN